MSYSGFSFVLLLAAISSEVLMSYFRVGPFPVRVYILLVFAVTFFGSYCLRKNKRIALLFPLKYLIGFVFIAVALQVPSVFEEKFLHYLSRGLLSSILIFGLTLEALNGNPSRLKMFLLVTTSTISFSAFFSIMQALDVGFFWAVRDALSTDADHAIATAIAARNRPVGFSYNSIELGYQISTVFPFALYYFTEERTRARWVWGMLSLVLLLGAVASETRTAVYAIIVSIIMIQMHLARSLRSMLLRISLVGVILGIVALGFAIGSGSRLTSLSDDSAQGKVFLIYMGLLYIVSHPFGAGILLADFIKFREDTLGLFSQYGEVVTSQVTQYTPHNQFVNTGVIYGWVGIVLICVFYVKLFKVLLNQQPDLAIPSGLIFAARASLVGYLINSLFHNAGPFVFDPFSWYFIGVICTIEIANRSWKEKGLPRCR